MANQKHLLFSVSIHYLLLYYLKLSLFFPNDIRRVAFNQTPNLVSMY